MLLGLLSTTAFAQSDQSPPSQPGFWDRVKTGAKAGWDDATHPKANPGPMGSSGLFPESPGPLYTPISGGHEFQGLFARDDHHAAQRGKLMWPRAALTFLEYGNMPCWKVRARIWRSPSSSHDEIFQICNAPIVEKDDLGQDTELVVAAVHRGLTRMDSVRTTGTNTGSERTTGPNPPAAPWSIDIARQDNGKVSTIQAGAQAMEPRLGWVSGFVNRDEMTMKTATLLNPFLDARLWFAGFDPNGRRN